MKNLLQNKKFQGRQFFKSATLKPCSNTINAKNELFIFCNHRAWNTSSFISNRVFYIFNKRLEEVKRNREYSGKTLKIYETDAGKIGILICYDVEFPELPRLLAEQGMQILFVPFLTDTQNAYNRVRYCAQARAIENECFVAITGCIGNLPKVENMDIQYSQSAVFTPCDFAFPSNGIKSEATANTEMILIADVDLSLLDELHAHGSVRNLKDRRTDFYEVTMKGQSSI